MKKPKHMTLHEHVLWFHEWKRRKRRNRRVAMVASIFIFFFGFPIIAVSGAPEEKKEEIVVEHETFEMVEAETVSVNSVKEPEFMLVKERIVTDALSEIQNEIDRAIVATEMAEISSTKEEEPVEPVDERLYDVPLEAEYQLYIKEMCEKYDVSLEIAFATIYVESNFDHGCLHTNKNGTVDGGLFQINSNNVSWMQNVIGEDYDVTNIYHNIEAGIYIISYSQQFDDDPYTYMMVYNMGLGGAQKNWRVGRYSTDYTKKLMNYVNTLQELKIG